MKTVITETTVKSGQEQAWDAVYHDRLAHAKQQPGFVGMELLIPEGEPDKRLVVGTWRSKDDWSNWHQTPGFQQTRDRMNAATQNDGTPRWFDVDTETFGR